MIEGAIFPALRLFNPEYSFFKSGGVIPERSNYYNGREWLSIKGLEGSYCIELDVFFYSVAGACPRLI